jgi:hypothetical protein
MNKIVLQVGLLVFCLGIIFFSRMELPVQDVLFRSFLIFVSLTVLLSIIVIMFIKAVNKVSADKHKEIIENNNNRK